MDRLYELISSLGWIYLGGLLSKEVEGEIGFCLRFEILDDFELCELESS